MIETKADIIRKVAEELGLEVIEIKVATIIDVETPESIDLVEVDGVWQMPKEA